MISKSRFLLLAATLMAAPMGVAMAQSATSGSPSYNAPRAMPNSPQMDSSSAATDPHQPGATGQTVVPGSSSSMAASHRVDPNPNAASTTAGAGGGGH